jgi:hypothetical protein
LTVVVSGIQRKLYKMYLHQGRELDQKIAHSEEKTRGTKERAWGGIKTRRTTTCLVSWACDHAASMETEKSEEPSVSSTNGGIFEPMNSENLARCRCRSPSSKWWVQPSKPAHDLPRNKVRHCQEPHHFHIPLHWIEKAPKVNRYFSSLPWSLPEASGCVEPLTLDLSRVAAVRLSVCGGQAVHCVCWLIFLRLSASIHYEELIQYWTKARQEKIMRPSALLSKLLIKGAGCFGHHHAT